MLSQRAKYTIRVMQELARAGPEQSLQAGELASRIKAPQHFLEGILLDLRREGLLTSRRGRSGGYTLAKPADLISIADLIRYRLETEKLVRRRDDLRQPHGLCPM